MLNMPRSWFLRDGNIRKHFSYSSKKVTSRKLPNLGGRKLAHAGIAHTHTSRVHAHIRTAARVCAGLRGNAPPTVACAAQRTDCAMRQGIISIIAAFFRFCVSGVCRVETSCFLCLYYVLRLIWTG